MLQDDDDAQVNRTDPTFSQSALSKVTARNIQIGQIMQTIVYLGLPLHSRHLCFGQLVANLGYLSCVIGGFIRLWQEGADLITYLLLIVGSGLLTLTCLYYVGFWKPEIEDKNSPSSDEAEKTQQKKHKTRQLTRRLALVGIFAIPLLTGGGYFFWKSLPPPGVRILVANFANSQYPDYRDDRQVTETILRNLRKATESYGEVEVQALSEAITEQQSSKVARARGESKKATIVIWGNYTASATDVQISTYFELLKSPTFFPELSQTDRGETQTAAIAQLDRFKLQTQLSNKMSYLTLFTLGMVQYSQKDWDKAIERFRDALDQVKTTPISDLSQSSVFFYRGTSYLSKSDYERAIVDYDKAIQLNPQNAFNYSNRGYAYYTEGEKDRAFADFDKAIQLGHQDAMAYFNRAAAYSDKGEKDRAIADYDKAIQLDPKLAKPYYNRGAAYSDKGEKDRAFADFDKAIQIDPQDALAYTNRGYAYSAKGEIDRAIADYDKAIQLDPKLAIAYVDRGNAYKHKGDYNKALENFDRAISLDPKNAAAYGNRGLVYKDKGEKAEALKNFKKAFELFLSQGNTEGASQSSDDIKKLEGN